MKNMNSSARDILPASLFIFFTSYLLSVISYLLSLISYLLSVCLSNWK